MGTSISNLRGLVKTPKIGCLRRPPRLFQLSGDVSDETAVSIGKMLGERKVQQL
jgi:hypothetical protein